MIRVYNESIFGEFILIILFILCLIFFAIHLVMLKITALYLFIFIAIILYFLSFSHKIEINSNLIILDWRYYPYRKTFRISDIISIEALSQGHRNYDCFNFLVTFKNGKHVVVNFYDFNSIKKFIIILHENNKLKRLDLKNSKHYEGLIKFITTLTSL